MRSVGGFDAAAADALAGENVDGELDVHGGLEGVAVEFAVSLEGVAVADVEQGAGVGDGKIDGGAFAVFVEVHVAAVATGVSAAGWGVGGAGCGGDAAEHWADGDGEGAHVFAG